MLLPRFDTTETLVGEEDVEGNDVEETVPRIETEECAGRCRVMGNAAGERGTHAAGKA